MPTPVFLQKRMLVKGSTLFVKNDLTLKSNHPNYVIFSILLPILLSKSIIFCRKVMIQILVVLIELTVEVPSTWVR